ncbi:MAG: NUDIX domain-containing protein [Oligoflexales bacterium]
MIKSKLIIISCISLTCLGILVAFVANSWYQPVGLAKDAIKTTLSESDQIKLASKLGIIDSWTPYTPAMNESIDKWKPETGKVIFQVKLAEGELRYLVAKKRARGRKSKDECWEFPGGRIDRNETALQATLRELREEDPTQTLYHSFLNAYKQNESTIEFKALKLANGERHVVFKLNIYDAELAPLLQLSKAKYPLSKEIYEFLHIPIEKLNTKKKAFRKLWTSKSRKILKSLRTIKSQGA